MTLIFILTSVLCHPEVTDFFVVLYTINPNFHAMKLNWLTRFLLRHIYSSAHNLCKLPPAARNVLALPQFEPAASHFLTLISELFWRPICVSAKEISACVVLLLKRLLLKWFTVPVEPWFWDQITSKLWRSCEFAASLSNVAWVPSLQHKKESVFSRSHITGKINTKIKLGPWPVFHFLFLIYI